MKKRVRDEVPPIDPFKERHQRCLLLIWMVRIDPTMRRCIPKDILIKIMSYIKVDLRNGIGGLMLCRTPRPHVWYWKDIVTAIRPCVGCLRPVSTKYMYQQLTCSKCINIVNLHEHCCTVWCYSISSACFEKFRLIYELPII